jgi:hypothetical protein
MSFGGMSKKITYYGIISRTTFQFDSTRMSLETKLQDASQDFQKLQVDLAQAVEARQQLDAQLSENEQVKKVEDIHYQLSTHTKS